MQAWRTNHYPKRNNWFNRPKIHTGFDKAWRNNKLNEKVLAKIEELFNTEQIDKDDVEFVVTGDNHTAPELTPNSLYEMHGIISRVNRTPVWEQKLLLYIKSTMTIYLPQKKAIAFAFIFESIEAEHIGFDGCSRLYVATVDRFGETIRIDR